MRTVSVIYTGGLGPVELHGVGTVQTGVPVDVPAALAGTAPSGGDPGSGLLAQSDIWQAAPAAPSTPRS